MHIVVIRKELYSDEYQSVDGMFEGSYTIYNLIDMFPNAYFLIINDDTEFHDSRIITRKRIKELFNIDERNQIRCENCHTKNVISRKLCRQCGYENKYFEVLQYYSEDFVKAAELKGLINEVW
jgi:hypothetical protein